MELCRFVAAGGELRPDPPHTAHGRGGYLCPELRCIQRALKRGAFGRALGVRPALDAAAFTRTTLELERASLARVVDGARRGRIAEATGDLVVLPAASEAAARRLRARADRVAALEGVERAERAPHLIEGRVPRDRNDRSPRVRRDGMDPRLTHRDPAGDE